MDVAQTNEGVGMAIIILIDKNRQNYKLDVPMPMQDLGVQAILQSALNILTKEIDALKFPPTLTLNKQAIIHDSLKQLAADLHHLYATILLPIEPPPKPKKGSIFKLFGTSSPKLPEYSALLTHPTYKPYTTRMKQEGDRLIKQNIAAEIESLKRISADFTDIHTFFLKPTLKGSDITLVSIQSMGSDRHHNGRVVKKITFSDSKHSEHVIYKPTSVMADAKLVGKTEGFKTSPSLLERMYRAIGATLPPPTYTILPKIDYGYMQYLGDPRSLRDTASAVLAGEAKSECITTNSKDIEQFSYDCGVLLIMMLITGCADSHLENLIVHGKRPHLIDNEVLFSPSGPTGALLCLNLAIGSMGPNYVIDKPRLFLNEVLINHYVNQELVSSAGKNLLFLLKDDTLTALRMNKANFLAGYHAALTVLQHKDIQSWFEASHLENTPIRAVPIATEMFETLQQWWFTSSTNINREELLIKNIVTLLKDAEDMASTRLFFRGCSTDGQLEKSVVDIVKNLLHDIVPELTLAIRQGDIPRFELKPFAKNNLISAYKVVIDKLVHDVTFKSLIEKQLVGCLENIATAEQVTIKGIMKPSPTIKLSL